MNALMVGSYAPDFELPGTDGAVHHLARYLERYQAIVVVFICNHCPVVKRYLDRLKQLQTELQSQGIALIGINANDEQQFPDDSYEQMKLFAAEHQLNFLYLRDVTQDVALAFKAETTPHAFLLNQQGLICYAGAIDDNIQPNAVKIHYLRNAIAALRVGQSVSLPATAPIGCSLKWRKP